MPLYRVGRPADPVISETLGTTSGSRGALISAANPAAAVVAANAIASARGYNDVFSTTGGWSIVDIATTPGGPHVNTLVDGDFSTVPGIWPGK